MGKIEEARIEFSGRPGFEFESKNECCEFDCKMGANTINLQFREG